ncbi:MAG TPA: phospho-N-acetylmuramoyl-pentapeptide-transferase, partial [Paludibacter sp.]|nr:phospho-N-acetylmuramoyl-pentapeptide-transferase [Paludibacter sp.]
MLYHLFSYLDQMYDFPGAGMFNYISFRTGVAFILALTMSTLFGRRIIDFLQRKQIGESIRDLGLEGQLSKKGTPTMGGIIIILAIVVPTLLMADLTNIYTILMLITTLWLGVIGFLDDYIKVFKKDKEGLKGKFKVVGQ